MGFRSEQFGEHPPETEQLRRLRERLNASLAAAGAAGSWDWDIKGQRLFMDGRLAAVYGIDEDEAARGLPTEAFFAAIEPMDVPRIRIAVAGMLHGAEVFFKTFRLRVSDGSVRWVEAHGRCHYDELDEPDRFSGLLVDVTARHRIEERLRIAQSAGGVGTFEYVPGFATALVSDQFCALLGLNKASVLPVRTINALVRPGQPSLLDPDGRNCDALAYAEIRVARADSGEERWIARRGETIRDTESTETRHVGVVYDITQTKRAEDELRRLNETLESRVEQEIASRIQVEEALRQSQKMEAVGQLTGGIAHDFNNLLTIVLGNLDTAIRRLGGSGDQRTDRALANALKGAERAAALTQRLLAFSRRQPLDPKPVNIGRLVNGMTDLLTRTLGETIFLRTDIPADLWLVEADANQLENALINLAVNARDAMEDGGDLGITAANLAAGAVSPGNLEAGDYVEIIVRDSGAGMSSETAARAFEPFYTTKDVGKGTGLGLSMVYGFVRQTGGDILIRSRLGEGASIHLFLPRLSRVQEEGLSPLEAAEPSRKGETILVVEDDDDVRNYAAESLRELGYDVLEASSGPEALRQLEQRSDVRLVMTDVIMPGMSGKDLADRIVQVRPGLPILYMSGYPRDVIMRNGRLEAGVELLQKPFAFTALAARVREMLEG